MRMTRYLVSRRVQADDAKLLLMLKAWPGESLSGIRGSFRAVSLPFRGNTPLFTSIGSALEYNLYAMWIPDNVLSGYVDSGSSPQNANLYAGVPREPVGVDEWDDLFRRVVFEFGTDGNEFYGANPDGTTTTYDPVKNVYRRVRGQTVPAVSDDDSTTVLTEDEPGIVLGPLGIQRLYSHETILKPESQPGASKSLPAPLSTLFNQFSGIVESSFSDSVDLSLPVMGSGGALLIGVVRYEVASSVGWAQSYITQSPRTTTSGTEPRVVDDVARQRALTLLHNGEMSAIQWQIQNGTSDMADYLRSILFGGDNFVELPATLGSAVNEWFGGTGGQLFASNDIVCHLKLAAVHDSPYKMRVV